MLCASFFYDTVAADGPAQAPAVAAGAPDDDLSSIRDCGELRILMTASPDLEELPRRVSPRDHDMAILLKLAERLKVSLKIIYVEKFEDMIPALLRGDGDIIADNICVTEARKKILAFSTPLSTIQDQIIAGAACPDAKDIKSLAGKKIMYEKGTSYIDSLKKLQSLVPSVSMAPAPDGVDTETLMHKVAVGEYQLSISDTNYTLSFLTYRNDIRVIYTFPDKQQTAWALRPGAGALLMIVNNVISENLQEYESRTSKGDLPEIKRRKILRVITRNNPVCYFIHRGRIMGFEYDLATRFAMQNGLNLIMIVPPKWSDMFPWLTQGKGDLIAAAVTATPKRRQRTDIAFCEPYSETSIKVVGRRDEKPFKGLEDLSGRTIAIRRNSSYMEKLAKLEDSGLKFKIEEVPDTLETFEIIAGVAERKYDLTLSDEQIFRLELLRRDDIKELFSLQPPNRHYWIVRSEDALLKKAVDNFFIKEYKGEFFNVTYNKYFKAAKTAVRHREVKWDSDRFVVSEYDAIIRKYSNIYNMHWLLIAAQIAQESGFDPKAESWLGTKGLMQMTPETAREMGFKEFESPENNIHAGVKYLSSQLAKQPRDLYDVDRICFALASYNAGFGHLLDARRLAEKMRKDPNRWFHNVEECMLLLEKPEYASMARHGYCRGSEPVKYVRDIMIRYNQYMQQDAKYRRPK